MREELTRERGREVVAIAPPAFNDELDAIELLAVTTRARLAPIDDTRRGVENRGHPTRAVGRERVKRERIEGVLQGGEREAPHVDLTGARAHRQSCVMPRMEPQTRMPVPEKL